jgi:hypothetical protein
VYLGVADEGDSVLNLIKADEALVVSLAIQAVTAAVNIKPQDTVVAWGAMRANSA